MHIYSIYIYIYVLYVVLEDYKSKARRLNKHSQLARSHSTDDSIDHSELSVVEACKLDSICPSAANIDFEDEHYAVSEEVIENERNTCEGNWLKLSSQEFSRNHGSIVEGTDVSDEQEPEDMKDCQSFLRPGLCRQDFQSLPERSYTLSQQLKNVFRYFRGIRRVKGFQPNHILLLWCSPSEEGSIKDVMLLTRVSFSPFDATATQFEMSGPNKAKIVLGQFPGPKFISLPRLLDKMSRTTLELRIANYTALSLAEIEVQSEHTHAADLAKQALDCYSDNDDNSDSSSDDDILDQRAHALRLAMGIKTKTRKQATKTRVAGAGSGNNKHPPPPPPQTQRKTPMQGILDLQKKKQTRKPKQSGPANTDTAANEGVADEVSHRLLCEWSNAIESAAGVLPKADNTDNTNTKAVPATTTTKATTGSSSSSGCAIPIESMTHPWRDSGGYCWKYMAETGKPCHLGLAP